jgi:hypothetical protein
MRLDKKSLKSENAYYQILKKFDDMHFIFLEYFGDFILKFY